jgi:hypothetical protein
MSQPVRHAVRLVIQYVCQAGCPSHYRVIAYPAPPGVKPGRIASREELLQRLAQVMPHGQIKLNQQAENITQVVFADNVELDSTQLAMLGLETSC